MPQETTFYDIYDFYYKPFWHEQWFIITMWSLLCVVLVAGAYFCYRLYRARRKEKSIPAWEWATAALNQLTPDALADQDAAKAYYFALTSIIKQYLQKRFLWKVTQLTDEELVTFLKENDKTAIVTPTITAIVQGAQLIKFAQADAMPKQAQTDLAHAHKIVRDTIPQEKP